MALVGFGLEIILRTRTSYFCVGCLAVEQPVCINVTGSIMYPLSPWIITALPHVRVLSLVHLCTMEGGWLRGVAYSSLVWRCCG